MNRCPSKVSLGEQRLNRCQQLSMMSKSFSAPRAKQKKPASMDVVPIGKSSNLAQMTAKPTEKHEWTSPAAHSSASDKFHSPLASKSTKETSKKQHKVKRGSETSIYAPRASANVRQRRPCYICSKKAPNRLHFEPHTLYLHPEPRFISITIWNQGFNQGVYWTVAKAEWQPLERKIFRWTANSSNRQYKSWIKIANDNNHCKAVMISCTTLASAKRDKYHAITLTLGQVTALKSNDTSLCRMKDSHQCRLKNLWAATCQSASAPGHSSTNMFEYYSRTGGVGPARIGQHRTSSHCMDARNINSFLPTQAQKRVPPVPSLLGRHEPERAWDVWNLRHEINNTKFIKK